MLLIAHRVAGAQRQAGIRTGAAAIFCALMSGAIVSGGGIFGVMAEERASPPAAVAPLAPLTATVPPAALAPTLDTPLTPLTLMPTAPVQEPTATPAPPTSTPPTLTQGAVAGRDGAVMAAFLDRLMVVESGGRDDARNPRSTAVGPYQFIESTFLDLARRHFQAETASLAPAQILALRTNRPFARRAAEAFTRDNADILANNALTTTPGNLRLSFLVGPNAAVRLLRAEAATPVITLLGANVVQANPFMAGMAARDLVAWSERSIAGGGGTAGQIGPRPPSQRALAGMTPSGSAARPVAQPNCKLELASCRRWIALATKKPANVTPKRLAAAAVAPRRAPTR